jgi:arginyl-tRNA synthetase
MTVNSRLEDIIKSAVWRSFGDAFKERDAFLSVSKLPVGDYQSTVALAINKELKLPPKEIANKIMENINGGNVLKSVDISGPGYINLYLSEEFISSELLKKLQDHSGRLAIAKVPQPEKVVVDFSSPNIAKEMHVVRSSILFFYFLSIKQTNFLFSFQFNSIGSLAFHHYRRLPLPSP